jgi:hypothetical protein
MSIDWRPVTVPAERPDPRGEQIPYDLTAMELSQSAIYQCWLEQNRRRQNERDAQRARELSK